MNQSAVAEVRTTQTLALPSLHEDLSLVEEKIREDLLRFRTCCADPRASK